VANPILITDTELQGNLKNVYADIRQQLFPISTVLLAQIKKAGPGGLRSLKWGGRNVYFDVVVNPPVNWGASDAGYLPNSSETTEVQGNVGIRRFYVTREFDNLGILGTQSKQAAFTSLKAKITEEIDGAMQLGMQEHVHGNGLGIRAIVSSYSAGPPVTIVATSPYGVSGAGQGGLWLYPGMLIAVRDATGATLRGRATVTAVSNSGDNVTLTLSAAISGTTGTDIIVAATANDDAYNQYANGLINITNRGGSYNTLHGINAGTAGQERWNAVRFTAGTDTDDAANPNEMDAWKLGATIGARSGKRPLSSPDEFLCLTTYGVQQKLIESFLAQRRFNVTGGEELELNGGYKALKLHGMAVVADEYNPAGTFYMVHKPSLAWVDAADWSPVQYENSGAVRFIDGRDAFQTSFKVYFNLMTFQRNAHGSIVGYADTQRYTPVV
jgi:hypothetical protein